MANIEGSEAVREKIVDHVETIRELGLEAPSNLALEAYSATLVDLKDFSHQTNRGKREVAEDLGMRVSDLEAMVVGKAVLDVGCGRGVFAQELARLKRTRITALDYNPDMLEYVKPSRDLIPVVGSGLDIRAAVGDEKYDVAFSIFSSLSWAETPEDKILAVDNAIQACKSGGRAVLLPIVQHIGYRNASRQALQQGRVLGFPLATDQEVEEVRMASDVADFSDQLVISSLLDRERSGEIDCTFTASKENSRNIPIHPVLSSPTIPRRETYSAIISVN